MRSRWRLLERRHATRRLQCSLRPVCLATRSGENQATASIERLSLVAQSLISPINLKGWSCEQRTFKVESLQPSCAAIASGLLPCATSAGMPNRTCLVRTLILPFYSPLPVTRPPRSFFPTDRLSGNHGMLRQTCVKPEMSSSSAARRDTSMILPRIKGRDR